MLLKEILNQLTFGELSQLKLGGAEAGEMNDTSVARVVPSINLGLTALFKRFMLKEGRITIPLELGQTLYTLEVTDLLKLERVLTDDDFEYTLNDQSDPWSLTTPSTLQLRLPADIADQVSDLPSQLKTTTLTAVYRARHPTLDPDNVDPEATEVALPDAYLEALCLYVGGRLHLPLPADQAGATWTTLFENECQKLEQQNLQIDQGSNQYQGDRFRRNGWA